MALAGALGVLTWRAELARRDADFQRDQAEDLIEFMLTDLRDRLEPVGRLDVLEAVGSRALGYYARQRIETLDAESLSRRATALMLLGNIDQRRGDLEAAEASFAAALATTAEQLRRDPANAQRIFDHAQAVFYVGDVAGDRGDLAIAEARMREYYDLALRLAAIDPEKPEWRLEVAYATSNLGALKQRAGAFDEAAAFFADSAAARRALSEADPGNSALAKSYAYALSWLALAELSRGSFRRAIEVLNEQIAIYDRLLAASPDDYSIFRVLVTAQRRLAEAYLCLGEIAAAKTAVAAAREMIDDLLARDDSVSEWRAGATYLAVYDALFLRLAGDTAGADAVLIHAVGYSDVVEAGQEPNRLTRNAIGYALAERLRYIDPDDPDARVIARRLLEFIETSERDAASRGGDDDDAPLIASWWVALSWFADATGERAQALAHARRGLDALAVRAGKLSVKERMTLAELLFGTCDAEAASAVMDELVKLDLAHPSFVELRKRAIQTQCLQSSE